MGPRVSGEEDYTGYIFTVRKYVSYLYIYIHDAQSLYLDGCQTDRLSRNEELMRRICSCVYPCVVDDDDEKNLFTTRQFSSHVH